MADAAARNRTPSRADKFKMMRAAQKAKEQASEAGGAAPPPAAAGL
eukprot:COSAG04_NODE_5172_length_1713_cov_3.344486_5_plen_45_part_01